MSRNVESTHKATIASFAIWLALLAALAFQSGERPQSTSLAGNAAAVGEAEKTAGVLR